MPKGWSLYLLKLVSRILIQTYCLSANYILVRVSIYGNDVKRMVGWVTTPIVTHGWFWCIGRWMGKYMILHQIQWTTIDSCIFFETLGLLSLLWQFCCYCCYFLYSMLNFSRVFWDTLMLIFATFVEPSTWEKKGIPIFIYRDITLFGIIPKFLVSLK